MMIVGVDSCTDYSSVTLLAVPWRHAWGFSLLRPQILYHDRLPITLVNPIIILLLSLTSYKPMPLGVAYGICPRMRAWVNL